MKIESILLRLDEDELSKLVSKPAFDILATLNRDLLQPDRLRGMVLKMVPPDAILRQRTTRNLLFEALRPEEAKLLAGSLALRGNDPYRELLEAHIRKNSKKESELFEFFEEVVPEPEPEIEASDVEEILPSRGLFPHQLEAVKEVREALEGSGHRVMLHMPTGAGKTRTAMRAVASYMFEKREAFVIWLSYSEELCDQAVDEFQRMWMAAGDRPVQTVRLYGRKTPNILALTKAHRGIFMVAGLKKMYEAAKKDAVFLATLADRASLVVMDEAHQAVARTYKFILQTLIERHADDSRLMGLSATPGRTWNDVEVDRELSELFNSKKVTIKAPGSPVDFLIRHGYIARPTQRPIDYSGVLTDAERSSISNALDIPESVLKRLAGEKARNLKIIQAVERLVTEGHERIILFGATVDHARDISFALNARGLTSNYITNKTLPAVRKKIIEDYKRPVNVKILCNFGILSMGFDAPKTSAVVIARPTKSLVLYSQMVGRCIRGPKAGGNKRCTIVTVVDTSLHGFGNVTDAFSNWEDVW